METLLYILQVVKPKHAIKNNFVWWKNSNFYVKSSYLILIDICNVCMRVEENILI